MARCKDCIHEKVCLHRVNIQTDTYAYMGVKYDTEKCEHYTSADVVPKSEVEALERKIKRLQKYNTAVVSKHYNDGKKDAAREIFEEIEELFRQHTDGGYYLNNAWIPEHLSPYTQDAVAELKKKYIESEGKE